MATLARYARRLLRGSLPPRQFPTTGFEIIDNTQLIEEETLEHYTPEEFYPVRIGEVFKEQYQVVGKLGYGGSSTAWICRDLLDHHHVSLKIGAHEGLSTEIKFLRHLKALRTRHAGSTLVRTMLDEFEVTGEHGRFQCIVHPPLAVPLSIWRRNFHDEALPLELLKLILQHLLISLDFLHTEAKMIHTDIQDYNIILGMDDDVTKAEAALEAFEKQELEFPGPRKIIGDRVIHTSRPLVDFQHRCDRPVLCDFGQARHIEGPFRHIQPYQYRAPEVILEIPWDEKVDIWNVAVMIWNIFENGNLFNTRGGPDDKRNNKYHLASMIALLGPPPKDFLLRTKGDRLWKLWFDDNGHWKADADIPNVTLETMVRKLEGQEKLLFLQFVRKMLKWKPEERMSARELMQDPWLMSTGQPALEVD